MSLWANGLLILLARVAAAWPAAVPGTSSLWVTQTPDYVRPYAVQRDTLPVYTLGQLSFQIPVTGISSGGAFTIQITNAPGSSLVAVPPHIHLTHHENFLCNRGTLQLWTNKDGADNTRVLSKGDYGAVALNTTHLFQYLGPDNSFTAAIFPGGFEALYYYLSSLNTTYPATPPFDPLAPEMTDYPFDITALEVFDVVPQLQYKPRTDAVNGAAPSGSVWHNGPNQLPDNAETPFYVADGYGPKYLNTRVMGYHVVQPVVTAQQSEGNFTISKITINRLVANVTVPQHSFPEPAAFQILDGQLTVNVGQETIHMLEGDVLFVPGNTAYSYWSEVTYTRFWHFSNGTAGLGSELIAGGQNWSSPVWPTYS